MTGNAANTAPGEPSPAGARRHSLALVAAVAAATSVHHIFRFGIGWTPKALVLLAVPFVLLALHRRTGRRALLIAYAAYAGGAVLLFGIVDGFLDHTLKVLGLANVTFLAGSDVEFVTTVHTLWSRQATYWFYEGTGVLTFMLSVPALVFTLRHVATELRRAQPLPDG